ncbi:MAG TPA: hypothetical protein VI589_05405 [Vicinamibacteria bacterium]
MQPPSTCQACHREARGSLLDYRRGTGCLHRESLLQCDICERFACADCLEVYDILSGYDFVCRDCVPELSPGPSSRNH